MQTKPKVRSDKWVLKYWKVQKRKMYKIKLGKHISDRRDQLQNSRINEKSYARLIFLLKKGRLKVSWKKTQINFKICQSKSKNCFIIVPSWDLDQIKAMKEIKDEQVFKINTGRTQWERIAQRWTFQNS